ncbi:SAM-dependent methyltransferase [Streptomyces griseocarneus]|nr:SAM-dependent methyltransferase [Streptomyces griseocarneus]
MSPTTPTPSFGEDANDALAPLFDIGYGPLYLSALRAVLVHGIPDLLADGPLPVDELARRSGTHAPSLKRVLRMLAMRGIFRVDEAETVHLTPSSELLRTGVPRSQRYTLLTLSDETFVRGAAGLEETLRTGVPGFEVAYGKPFFEHLQGDPATQRSFDLGMSAMSGRNEPQIAASYAFPAEGTVIDIAGGRGGLLRAVLTANPGLHGVLFDQPQTVAHHVLDDEKLTGRWSTESGDFFSAVPPGGDIYILKHILHDWNDEDCLRILRTVRRAVEPGTKLLVIDAALPTGEEPHPGKALDVMMLALVPGRERTEPEFAALLTAAGFTLNRVLPTPSFQSIVEAVAI